MQPSGESPSKWVSPIICTGERGNPTAFQCPEPILWGVLILPVSSKKRHASKDSPGPAVSASERTNRTQTKPRSAVHSPSYDPDTGGHTGTAAPRVPSSLGGEVLPKAVPQSSVHCTHPTEQLLTASSQRLWDAGEQLQRPLPYGGLTKHVPCAK